MSILSIPWGELTRECEGLLRAAAWEILFSTLVFLVVFVLTRFLRGRAPSLSYFLWALVLVRLLLPPGFAHPLGLGTALDRWLEPSAQPPISPMSLVGEIPAGVMEGGSDAVGVGHPATAIPWAAMILALWALGSIIVAWSLVRKRSAIRHLIREAVPIDDDGVLSHARSWQERLAIRRSVRWLATEAKVTPFTWGILRPVVVLPRTVLEKPGLETMESVVAHELAHVARWDGLWLLLQQIVHVVWFFHPAARLAGAALNEERERLCDALVLSRGCIPTRTYAKCLLEILELNLGKVEAPGLKGSQRRIVMRMNSIVKQVPGKGPRTAWALVLALLLGAFLLPMRGSDVQSPELPKAAAASEMKKPTSVSLVNPVPGARVSFAYGEGLNPWTHKVFFHKGMDLAAPLGTPVIAPAPGIVEVATEKYEKGEVYGTVILLDHGSDLKTFYSHLGTLKVKPGQKVGRGETIALVGSTGKSTGPHVHFEVRQDGETVNPRDLVTGWD